MREVSKPLRLLGQRVYILFFAYTRIEVSPAYKARGIWPSPFNMDSSLVRNCHLVCSSVVCPLPADTPTASTMDGGYMLAKCVYTVYPPQSRPPRRNVGAQGTRHAQTQETAWPRPAHAAAI